MSHYTTMITAATGVTDPARLAQIEQCMREDIFHSTLDWQTKAQFNKGARDAREMLYYMESPEGRAYMAELEKELEE